MNTIRCLRPLVQTVASSSPSQYARSSISKCLRVATNSAVGVTRKQRARKFSRSTIVANVSSEYDIDPDSTYTLSPEMVLKKHEQIQRRFLLEKAIVAPQVRPIVPARERLHIWRTRVSTGQAGLTPHADVQIFARGH
eukprot:1195414-Prorocentrum_minimum.AAC.3